MLQIVIIFNAKYNDLLGERKIGAQIYIKKYI